MSPHTTRFIDYGRLIQGSNFVVLGILCWLWQRGHLSFGELASLWPLVLVSIGLSSLADPDRKPGERGAWGLMLAGALLLLGNHLTPEEFALEIWFGFLPLRLSWPLLLVAVGGYLVWREKHPKREER